MKKFISFGNLNRNYKYILFAILFRLFNNSLSQINYYTAFEPLRLIPTDIQKEYSNHGIIRQIFYYLGTFIIAFIFSKIKDKKTQEESNKARNRGVTITLIYTEIQYDSKTSFFELLFMIFLMVLMEQLLEKYNNTFSHLDFWMIEIIIISYITSKLLKKEIYKHQKFVLYFNLIPILFKLITIILSYKGTEDDESNNKKKLKIIYIVYWYLIPIGLLFNFPLIITKSYVYVKMKYYMDLKYISANRLLKLYGLFGFIFYTFICSITTFIKCKKESETDIYDYICGISYDGYKYFESFTSYFLTSSEVKEIFLEILAIILGMISFYFYNYYCMMIIKYLTPVHYIFLSPIYFFFFKVFLIIYNIFYLIINKKGKFLEETDMNFTKEIFFLDVSGDIFCLIGFLIYLEIIQLNCFDLSFNVRDNIERRSRDESINMANIINPSDTFDEDDGDVQRIETVDSQN